MNPKISKSFVNVELPFCTLPPYQQHQHTRADHFSGVTTPLWHDHTLKDRNLRWIIVLSIECKVTIVYKKEKTHITNPIHLKTPRSSRKKCWITSNIRSQAMASPTESRRLFPWSWLRKAVIVVQKLGTKINIVRLHVHHGHNICYWVLHYEELNAMYCLRSHAMNTLSTQTIWLSGQAKKAMRACLCRSKLNKCIGASGFVCVRLVGSWSAWSLLWLRQIPVMVCVCAQYAWSL